MAYVHASLNWNGNECMSLLNIYEMIRSRYMKFSGRVSIFTIGEPKGYS